MTQLSKEHVQRIAEMAKLALTEEEATQYTEHINSLIKYVSILDEVDTTGVEPTVNVIDLKNVMRKDEPIAWISQEEALKNAPDKQNGHFRVPSILD